MTELVWDQVGERTYETGVDHGVLYLPNGAGVYNNGVAWNGLTNVTETPSGAEPNAQYADNIKYLNLFSAEEFGATLEAFTYPDEFAEFDGLGVPTPGVTIGQQTRRAFGLSYRTLLGNDVEGESYGYKLHLVYGCTASPSEKAYGTVNDTPEPINFSWEISTVPVAVPGMKPTSIITVDSTKVAEADLQALEQILYGTVGTDPALPLPGEIITIFDTGLTTATPSVPAFDSETNTITIPSVVGVNYYDGTTLLSAGPYEITEDTLIKAYPKSGYTFPAVVDTDWLYVFEE